MNYQYRLTSLQTILNDAGLNGMLVFPGPNLQYLIGHRGSFKLVPMDLASVHKTMIPPRDFLVLVVPSSGKPTLLCARKQEVELIEAGPWSGEIIINKPENDLGNFVVSKLHQLLSQSGAVALDERSWWGISEWLQDKGYKARFENGSSLLYLLRARKDEKEILSLKMAAEVADNALEEGIGIVSPGISEAKVASIIYASLIEQGAHVHNLIVASGATRNPEVTTTKVIEKGDIILIDINTAYNGYYCDMTRVFVCGTANESQAKVYKAVREAWEAAYKTAKPNVFCSEVDSVARKVLKDNGLDNYFTHSVGHGIGLEDHECIWLYDQSPYQLEVGSVHTIEPAVYLPDFSFRLEDVVVIRETGADQLTKTSLDLREIN